QRREKKEQHKIFACTRPDRTTCACPQQSIEHQTEATPKRKQQLSRPHARKNPVRKPGNRHQPQPDPTMYRPKANFSNHVCETMGSARVPRASFGVSPRDNLTVKLFFSIVHKRIDGHQGMTLRSRRPSPRL